MNLFLSVVAIYICLKIFRSPVPRSTKDLHP